MTGDVEIAQSTREGSQKERQIKDQEKIGQNRQRQRHPPIGDHDNIQPIKSRCKKPTPAAYPVTNGRRDSTSKSGTNAIQAKKTSREVEKRRLKEHLRAER